ncbi:MAG: hypothetical protein EBS26_03245 [Bacteroidia bacterium]|nr:hypothetical protein [Bacteroidia bacterium]
MGQDIFLTLNFPKSEKQAAITISKVLEGVLPKYETWFEDSVKTDSNIVLQIISPDTGRCVIRVNQFAATLHVMPAGHYTVYWPMPDSLIYYTPRSEHPVFPELDEHAPVKLNYLIRDFQQLINARLYNNIDGHINRRDIIKNIDSLYLQCKTRYANITDAYFTTYWQYTIGQLQLNVSYNTKALYQYFIARSSVNIKHPAVLAFLSSFYNDYIIQKATSLSGTSIFNIINEHASLQLLNTLFKDDAFLQNDTIAQWVFLNNFWNFCYDIRFNKNALHNILKELQASALNRQIQRQCEIVLSTFNTLQNGFKAPDFTVYNNATKAVSLSNFKGKWVYICFTDYKSKRAKLELQLLKKWQNTYGVKIQFLSVLINAGPEELKQYIIENPTLSWPITYFKNASGTSSPITLYQVYGTEAYVMIDPKGNISQIPAPAPSEGIEQLWKSLLRPSSKSRKIGIR